jgi:hypothetical protein
MQAPGLLHGLMGCIRVSRQESRGVYGFCALVGIRSIRKQLQPRETGVVDKKRG